jgi:hypothetical protein
MLRHRDAPVWRRWTYWKELKIVNSDQTLIEIRSLARLLYEHWDGIRTLRPDVLEAKAFRLAELVNALDERLCQRGVSGVLGGGPPPRPAWTGGPCRPSRVVRGCTPSWWIYLPD